MPSSLTLAAEPAVPHGNSAIIAVILTVLTLFGGGAWVAFLRLRKEGPKIIVEAAQGAVVVQSGVIDDLQAEVDRAKAQIGELRAELADAMKLHRRVRELEHSEERLKAENARLKSQVRDLQQRVNELERSAS